VIAEAPYLLSVAALSVSLAGFAGVIAAFRGGAGWRPVDLFRVREIVEFGFVNALLALSVIPLFASIREEGRAVSIACALAALYLVVTTFALVQHQRAVGLRATVDWYLSAAIVLLGRPMLAFGFVLTLVHRDAR
jgi:hypothetical protein